MYLIIDLFIYILCIYLFLSIYLFIFNAHTVNPNAMPHSAASHLGPHCSAELVLELFNRMKVMYA